MGILPTKFSDGFYVIVNLNGDIFLYESIIHPVALQPYRALADRAAAAGQRS
jgi:hypothetical protein